MVRSFVGLFRRFLSCLGCSSRPSTQYFFLTVHYFNSFVPIAQQAGQAVVQVRLSSDCVSVVRAGYKTGIVVVAGRGNALLAVTGRGQTTQPRGLTLDLSQAYFTHNFHLFCLVSCEHTFRFFFNSNLFQWQCFTMPFNRRWSVFHLLHVTFMSLFLFLIELKGKFLEFIIVRLRLQIK